MDQLIGKLLYDRYRIQSLLGHQTGRRTFLASDLRTRTTVVIKLLLFGPDFTWEALKLFEREAEVLKALNHAAIPQYLDSFEVKTKQGNGFALAQTYIEARSLQDWVQSGRTFSEEDLKEIAKALLDILNYMHCRQPSVIHRDIKPSNILLGDRSGHSPGQIYLVDFGAVQTVVHGGTRTIVGTYGYMPPEQFGGQTTPASDLYALGATLICLAAGQHPDQLPQREMQILFENRVNLSVPLIDWLKWLTEPSLDRRLNSAKQALEALETASTRFAFVAKPIGSTLKVAQAEDEVEILIPPPNRRFIRICSLACHLFSAVLSTGMFIMFGAGSFIMAFEAFKPLDFFGLFASAFILVCAFPFAIGVPYFSLEAWKVFCRLFGVRLRLTSQKVTVLYELFGATWFRIPFTRTVDLQKITRIEYTASRHSIAGTLVLLSPHIDIWVGRKKWLTFGLDEAYSTAVHVSIDAEFRWLEQVLNDAHKASMQKEREK